MQFYNWVSHFDCARKRFALAGQRHNSHVQSYRDFYPWVIDDVDKHLPDSVSRLIPRAELRWYERKRPYYSVYPAIIPMLTNVKLAIPTSEIKLPLDVLLVRLPVEETRVKLYIDAVPERLRSLLLTIQESKGGRWLFLAADTGRTGPDDITAPWPTRLPLSDKITVDEAINNLPEQWNRRATTTAVKLVCALCLLANDPNVIRPEVLVDDRQKYAETGDQKYVEKARRRGVVGWSVGEEMEKVPHFRRGHFAVRWTGRGRTEQRIVYIQPTIVHREVTSQIPTGYLDGATGQLT